MTIRSSSKRPNFSMLLTDQINVVVNCTPIHVKIKSKLTNLMKISRIEGYNGKYGSIPQGIGKFLMISLSLVKSDNESMIEIEENEINSKRRYIRIKHDP